MTPRVPEVEMLRAFRPWVRTPSRVRDLHVPIRTPSRVRDRHSRVRDRTPGRVRDCRVAIRTPASHGSALRSGGVRSRHVSHRHGPGNKSSAGSSLNHPQLMRVVEACSIAAAEACQAAL